MLTKNANMPFLSLHALAAARGDGLRPEFVKLFHTPCSRAPMPLFPRSLLNRRQDLPVEPGKTAHFEQAAPQECVGRRKY